MTGKMERDIARWNSSPTVMPEGWTRIAVTAKSGQYPWALLPDDVAEEVDRPIMFEWRPSSIMGWGLAAVWVGPKEQD